MFVEMVLTPMSQMVTDTFAEQVLVAVGEGAKAALRAYEYLLPTL